MVPDAPQTLVELKQVAPAGFVWTDGESDGGTDIIDYQIWFDQGDLEKTDHVLFAERVLGRNFTATGL
jgi:hypothetical protein